jgi:hypothetical protein
MICDRRAIAASVTRLVTCMSNSVVLSGPPRQRPSRTPPSPRQSRTQRDGRGTAPPQARSAIGTGSACGDGLSLTSSPAGALVRRGRRFATGTPRDRKNVRASSWLQPCPRTRCPAASATSWPGPRRAPSPARRHRRKAGCADSDPVTVLRGTRTAGPTESRSAAPPRRHRSSGRHHRPAGRRRTPRRRTEPRATALLAEDQGSG